MLGGSVISQQFLSTIPSVFRVTIVKGDRWPGSHQYCIPRSYDIQWNICIIDGKLLKKFFLYISP